MKLTAAFLLGLAAFAESPVRVSRASLNHQERSMDDRIVAVSPDEPGYLLGPTRGVYLEGYGVVFTAEVDLLSNAAPNPFRPSNYSKQDLARLKGKKQTRITLLKQQMQNALVAAAVPLDGIPAEEIIALAVTIPYFPWEDGKDLPRQILMSAPRSVLQKGAKGDKLSVDNGLKIQEFF
jgi:hypothetical protein